MLLTGIGDRKIERVLLPLAIDLPVTSEDDPDASNKPVSQGAYKAYVSSVATPSSGENQGNSNVNNNNGNQDNASDSDYTGCYGSDSSVQQPMIAQQTQRRRDAPTTLHETSQTNTEISRRIVRDDKVVNQCDADEAEFYRDFYCDDDVTQWSTPGAWTGDAMSSCSDGEDCLLDRDYQSHFCQQQSQCYWRVLCRSHDNVNTSTHLSCGYNANVNNNAGGGAGEQVPDDAATESKAVTVMVYGDKDVAGPIELDNGDVDMFTTGKLDEFDVSDCQLLTMPLKCAL